jgi:hypothetical protein
MLYDDLTAALGYTGSALFREDDGTGLIAPSDRHWIRAAREAGTRGSYFFRTSPSPGSVRPVVHVAEASNLEEAREIHRRLWNQGINPFLIVVLPAEVRVFAGFAYHPTRPKIGVIRSLPVERDAVALITQALSAFSSNSIDRGEIWKSHAKHLGSDKRVDTTLLANLRALSDILQKQHEMTDKMSHALIGQFVYLSYLRARDILSDKWLQDEAGVKPDAVFIGGAFCASITLESFRALEKEVEGRFNGRLFPIAWDSRRAPKADAIRTIARVFAGEDVLSGQLHLPFTAYDFSYIPVEFLSSIYEQFLHAEVPDAAKDGNNKREVKKPVPNPERRGAHYTPEPLADYLVSEVDSVRPLRAGMKILDPCCGSGVFLVVAFRRLVELECARQGRASLNARELRYLLETSIYGVERNLTACQIANFSLILALLSYVDPPELHRRPTFKFPALVGTNLFNEDFFDESGRFREKTELLCGEGLAFDWIIGNPPWIELDSDDPEAKLVLDWSKKHGADYWLARARTGEAFAWRVMDCLAADGAVGMILHAKSLTNDHLYDWRKKFFGGVHVHRVTNFANLAYVVFASAKQPAATVVYTRRNLSSLTSFLLHVGPFVANQHSLGVKKSHKRRVWTIGFSESEIKRISIASAAKGEAATWKLALWGNQRDESSIKRLQHVFSTRLGKIADARGWSISLGLQLRKDGGTEKDPNEYIAALEGLRVLDHRALIGSGPMLRIQPQFLGGNPVGCYVRKGRHAGLELTSGPRLFLWQDFAAYAHEEFIFRHDKIGLKGGDEGEMKAVAAIWNTSYARYLLFFVASAAWGIGVSQIDKGDAENLPFPELTPESEHALAMVWDEAAALEDNGEPFSVVREFIDWRVTSLLAIPETVSLVVRDFFRMRYQLNQGKAPAILGMPPDEIEMYTYATRLKRELDAFLGGTGHHKITVLHSHQGVSVSIALTRLSSEVDPEVRLAIREEGDTLRSLLQAAESQFSQWVYVKRSVRIFDGDTIHLIKPPRRLEWTETQALLDADDIIAEVIEVHPS